MVGVSSCMMEMMSDNGWNSMQCFDAVEHEIVDGLTSLLKNFQNSKSSISSIQHKNLRNMPLQMVCNMMAPIIENPLIFPLIENLISSTWAATFNENYLSEEFVSSFILGGNKLYSKLQMRSKMNLWNKYPHIFKQELFDVVEILVERPFMPSHELNSLLEPLCLGMVHFPILHLYCGRILQNFLLETQSHAIVRVIQQLEKNFHSLLANTSSPFTTPHMYYPGEVQLLVKYLERNPQIYEYSAVMNAIKDFLEETHDIERIWFLQVQFSQWFHSAIFFLTQDLPLLDEDSIIQYIGYFFHPNSSSGRKDLVSWIKEVSLHLKDIFDSNKKNGKTIGKLAEENQQNILMFTHQVTYELMFSHLTKSLNHPLLPQLFKDVVNCVILNPGSVPFELVISFMESFVQLPKKTISLHAKKIAVSFTRLLAVFHSSLDKDTSHSLNLLFKTLEPFVETTTLQSLQNLLSKSVT